MAAHPQARRARPRRLGCRGPPPERQDRPHQRRGQGEPRRDLGQRGAGGHRRDRPRGCQVRGPPAPPRADARDARVEAVQRPRLAVRDQVGRLSRPGGRGRRQGPDLDPQPQRRRDLLPAIAQPAGSLDRGRPGHRGWRGRRARRGRSAGLQPPPDQARGQGSHRARVPGVRPALPRRTVARRRPARGPQATAPERAQGAPDGSATRPTSRGRGSRSTRRRPSWASRGSWPSSVGRGTSRGGDRTPG